MNEKRRVYTLFILTALLLGGAFFIITYGPTGFDTFQIGIAMFNVLSTVDVNITKTDSPDPIFQGNTLSYFILVNISGNATNVTVVETYPGNIVFNGSQPPPTSGNDTWFLGNLTNTTFQINITVNVSPTFTGVLVNNVTVFFNDTFGVPANDSDTETTTVIGNGTGGQGGGSGGAGECIVGQMQVSIGGQRKEVFLCCSDDDCLNVWGLQDNICRMQPPILAARCVPKQYLETPAPTAGICPTAQTCGIICCPSGTSCKNSECMTPEQAAQLPEPPESFYVLSFKETSLLWILFFLLLSLITLFLVVLIAAIGEHKKKKRRK